MREVDKMNQGKLYDPFRLEEPTWKNIREALKIFNESRYWEDRAPLDKLRSFFKHSYDDLSLVPPFYCDHGLNISIGRHFQGNTELLILDEGQVQIGDDVLIGPRVSIYTVNHPMDPDLRKLDLEYAQNVVISDQVWIAGNVVINAGVKIGKGSVIGSGSVVTHDIPDHVFAAGNPCRVIRTISQDECQRWQERYRREQDE